MQSQDDHTCTNVPNYNQKVMPSKVTTIEDVRGFLFAKTMQQPKSTALVNTPTVSELAEQSTSAKPVISLNTKSGFK